jgi:hypothetical protein
MSALPFYAKFSDKKKTGFANWVTPPDTRARADTDARKDPRAAK